MSKGLAQRKESEREFLEQLLDTSKVQNYSLPVEIKAQLRQYQQVSCIMFPKSLLLIIFESKRKTAE